MSDLDQYPAEISYAAAYLLDIDVYFANDLFYMSSWTDEEINTYTVATDANRAKLAAKKIDQFIEVYG